MTTKQILNNEIKAIEFLKNVKNDYNSVVDIILNNKGKCIFSGVGKAGTVATLISEKFNSIGIKSFFLNPLNAQHGDIGVLDKNDIFLLFSNSGKTREIIELVDLIKKMYNNTIILITSHENSLLAKRSNIVLNIGYNNEMIEEKNSPLGLVPTISTTLMNLIGDILVVLLIEKKNLKIKEYSLYHNSGYINKLIENVFIR